MNKPPVLVFSMDMTDHLDTIIVALGGIATTITGWVIGRRRNRAEADKVVVDTALEVLSAVREELREVRDARQALRKESKLMEIFLEIEASDETKGRWADLQATGEWDKKEARMTVAEQYRKKVDNLEEFATITEGELDEVRMSMDLLLDYVRRLAERAGATELAVDIAKQQGELDKKESPVVE